MKWKIEKTKRKINPNLPNIGPGDYYSEAKWGKFSSIKGSFSFASTTHRNFSLTNSRYPGPGSYSNPLELNRNLMHSLKMKMLKSQSNSQQRLIEMLAFNKETVFKTKRGLMINITKTERKGYSGTRSRKNLDPLTNIDIMKTMMQRQFQVLLKGTTVDTMK